MSTIVIVLTIILYLVMMLYVGFRFSKTNSSVDDFYLGGRKLGPLVTAMSAEASDMSSYLLMGLPGLAVLTGIADPGWTAIGLAIGTYLNWLIVARRIRIYTHETHSITIPDFFSNRYGDKKHILSSIAAVIIIIFFIPYTASGFSACGKLFNMLFGMNYITAMLLSAAIIVAYCTLGGFLAASTTDLIQSIVMTIALIIVIVFGVHSVGGFGNVMDAAHALPGYFSLTEIYDPTTGTGSTYGALTSVSMLAWGLGYFGMPHILLRFMATEDAKKLKTSRRIATTWVIISMAVAIFIGVVAMAMVKTGILGELADAETAIIAIAQLISSHGIFASFIAGIILAGILAATMSTADSQLLAAASSVSQNILSDLFGIKLSEKKSMTVARVTVIVIAIIAVFLARDPNSSVFRIVSFAWAGFGATFGPVVLFALFWKRSNLWGALAGMIAGGVMVFVWKFAISTLGGAFAIYELLPAFITACVVNVVVTLLTPAPERPVIDMFERVSAIKE